MAKAGGYVYLVAVLGVTGVRDHVSEEAIDLLNRVRRHTTLPLALGFGISTPGTGTDMRPCRSRRSNCRQRNC